jgi:general secretion pathway protein G
MRRYGKSYELTGGWTFIESIIVITIILVLTGTVGVSGMRYVDKARCSSARNEMAALSLALDGYYLDCGCYPTETQGLEALWSEPTQSPIPEKWDGPYVSKEDWTDPWGAEYIYANPGPEGLPYGIHTYGADGVAGGEGKNEDMESWDE